MGQAEDDDLLNAAVCGNVAALREAVRKGAQLECRDSVRLLILC